MKLLNTDNISDFVHSTAIIYIHYIHYLAFLFLVKKNEIYNNSKMQKRGFTDCKISFQKL